MKTEDLVKFFKENDEENIKWYIETLLVNLRETSKISFRYLFYLALIALVFYLSKSGALESIKLNIVEVTKLEVIRIFIPPVFCMVFLVFSIGENRRENLIHQIKLLFNLLYEYDKDLHDYEKHPLNRFNVSFLPFHLSSEIHRAFDGSSKMDIVAIILVFIIYIILMGPIYWFEYILLKDLWGFWESGLLAKLSFFISAFLCTITIFYNSRMSLKNKYENNLDKEYIDNLLNEAVEKLNK